MVACTPDTDPDNSILTTAVAENGRKKMVRGYRYRGAQRNDRNPRGIRIQLIGVSSDIVLQGISSWLLGLCVASFRRQGRRGRLPSRLARSAPHEEPLVNGRKLVT